MSLMTWMLDVMRLRHRSCPNPSGICVFTVRNHVPPALFLSALDFRALLYPKLSNLEMSTLRGFAGSGSVHVLGT